MILNNSSEVIHFEKTPISQSELLGLGFPKNMRNYINNVVTIDGKYYYVKKCSTSTLINELLGTYFSSLIGLDSVDYRIGCNTNESTYLYAVSEIFYRDDYSYTTVEDAMAYLRPDDSKAYSRSLGSLYICDTSVLSMISSEQIINGALKMTAVDLKMGQVDRYNYNVILRDNGMEKEIEKIFDFGWSYAVGINDNKYCYYNPFLTVRRNTISIWGLACKYPQIRKSAAILCEIPVYDALKEIEKRFNVKIEDRDIPRYIELDQDYSKLLRKIR